jgi:hypothetical protein
MRNETPRKDWRRYLPRLLLLIPFLVVLWVPSYNRLEPKLGDISFSIRTSSPGFSSARPSRRLPDRRRNCAPDLSPAAP